MIEHSELLGLGLVIVIAVGAELIAGRLRLPAIVLLLPAGFLAGIATDDIHPGFLLGDAYQPMVSLGVGLILFEAGMRLRLAEVQELRSVVVRLLVIGIPITFGAVTIATHLLFGFSVGISAVIGAILVVSGPTVVLPLLAFVRPTDRIRSTLKWEGVLIDPLGAMLGVVAFHAVNESAGHGVLLADTVLSIGVGAAVGIAAAVGLIALLRSTQRTNPREGVPIMLMMVIAALVAADLLRSDSGFVATTVMGLVMANQRRVETSRILDFGGTLVHLLIGILFVIISASVQPAELDAVLPEALGLIAVMVLVRPLVVAVASWGSPLDWRERTFAAFMAPRGIVAAATASAFGLQLTNAGVANAEKILPIAFLAIFGTVVIYGVGSGPLARRLGIAGTASSTALLVGGHDWARQIAAALDRAGVEVRLWTGREDEKAAAANAGLAANDTQLAVDAAAREAELEDIDCALLLTGDDDFNTLAAFELRQELGVDCVYRVAAAPGDVGLIPTPDEAGVFADAGLTFAELDRRFADGASLAVTATGDETPASAPGHGSATRLFLVGANGQLQVLTPGQRPEAGPGDVWIELV